MSQLEAAKQSRACKLQAILDQHKDKRVVVLGTTCSGKSTMVRYLVDAYDMDKLLFPQLTQEETDYVCQEPWTPEIGAAMIKLARERVKVEPGKPVFGTIILDADVIIYLEVDDEALRKQTELRGVSFTDAKNMQQHIEAEVALAGVPVIRFTVRE